MTRLRVATRGRSAFTAVAVQSYIFMVKTQKEFGNKQKFSWRNAPTVNFKAWSVEQTFATWDEARHQLRDASCSSLVGMLGFSANCRPRGSGSCSPGGHNRRSSLTVLRSTFDVVYFLAHSVGCVWAFSVCVRVCVCMIFFFSVCFEVLEFWLFLYTCCCLNLPRVECIPAGRTMAITS